MFRAPQRMLTPLKQAFSGVVFTAEPHNRNRIKTDRFGSILVAGGNMPRHQIEWLDPIQGNVMNITARSLDTNAPDQQNGPDQQYDALSDEFGNGGSISQATAIPNPDEDAMMSHVPSASPRGDVTNHGSSDALPSQILPKERRIQAMAWEKRRGTKLALMFLDADRFQTVNDALAALLPEGADRQEDAEIVLAQQAPQVGVTIGISMDPTDGDDAETLIQHADIAVYHSENRAGDSYHLFTPGMHARVIE